MSKIKILSKSAFNKLMESAEDGTTEFDKTCFISILNSDFVLPDERSYFDTNIPKNALVIKFDDVSNDEYYCEIIDQKITKSNKKAAVALTVEQANTIVDFIEEQINNNVTQFIIHCTAGISRSGAVGDYISQRLNINHSDFRDDNPSILPNPYVLSLLKRVARQKEII